LKPYFSAVEKELNSYGFQVQIESVDKKIKSAVDSAFIKGTTKIHFLKIESLNAFHDQTAANSKLQIKFEVDTHPCVSFEYETRYLLAPTSFPVISLKKPDLFAGKIHALLFRKWKNRIKGRDFYDYVWYLKNKVPVRLRYLAEKAEQSGHAQRGELETIEQLKQALEKRIKTVDFENAKDDIRPFIKDHRNSRASLQFQSTHDELH
jgi:hypothetical protein